MQQGLKARLSYLYEAAAPDAQRFRYAILALDLVAVLFIIVSSFMPRSTVTVVLDIVFGGLILTDFLARVWIAEKKTELLWHWSTWIDVISVLSFFAPLGGEGGGFLRILRTLRLLHTYQMLGRLRADFEFFRRNEEVFLAATHLLVFIFIMTGIVYETQHWSNPNIANYFDALYFTVTALTTTGFGDITLPGATGRLISVLIMLFGVTLFLRLAQVLFRPTKVRHPCPTCGLQRHEYDAVHCKACGHILNIPDENE